MANNILVLTSGRTGEPPVVKRALEVAAAGAELELFDVVYEPLLEGYMGNREIYEPLRRRVVAEREERAAELARSAAASGRRTSAKAVWDHPLHEAVAKEVRARNADLLVAAPTLHGTAGMTHSDWQLVLTSPAPTLVVKSEAAVPYAQIVAAVDPLHAHAKPAALDAEILRHAQSLAAATGAQLTVLHCYTPVPYFGADLRTLPAAHDPDQRRQAVETLLAQAGIDAAVARVVAGDTDEVIGSLAASGAADLVVMGVLARSWPKQVLIGHTAERVLHQVNVDVLVVKPQPTHG
jgi:universal stress protein E